MKISSVNFGIQKYAPNFERNVNRGVENPLLTKDEVKLSRKQKIKKVLPWMATIAVGASVIGIGVYSKLKKGKPIKDYTSDVVIMSLLALAGFGEIKTKAEAESAIEKIKKGESPLQKEALNNRTTYANATLPKYTNDFYGLNLLVQNNVLNRNEKKYNQALKDIETVGLEKLTAPKEEFLIDKENPTLWSVSSEFAPIKEGGLGSVPPEIRNNAEKLGVNVPTFVPMYLNNGSASLVQNGDKYQYMYKGKQLELEKMATIKIDVYKNSEIKSIPVTFFLNTDKNGNKLILIKADDYFDGTIYEGNTKTEEPEKFAVLSKAVYEFAKLKMDDLKASKEVIIHSKQAFDEIDAPDGMILNDWQASPTLALLRYKASMENAYGQLSDSTAQQLKDMKVVTIGHNATYQGSTQNNNNLEQRRTATNNILNTLFDKYTFDIVSHAESGATKINPEDEGLKKLDNVLLLEHDNPQGNYTNFLNMGIILSDYFAPVSENYAKELISPEHRDLSNMLQFALVQKAKAGKLVGIINGNDFENLCIQAKNKDVKKLTGLEFEEYEKTDDIEDIIQARLDNKIKLYNDYILPFSNSEISSKEDIEIARKTNPRLEFVEGIQGTDLPILEDEEFNNTPILMSGGRLVSQKGMDILCDALEMLYDNWEEDFGDRNKPIVYIAGADNEGGQQKRIIEDLKNNKLSKEDNDRVLFAHGFSPMAAMMAGSDFFLMPSKFEPCGLTQSESFALGTPVIASAVGGIVDTVNRNGKENGILTDKNEKLTAEGFYESIKKGLKIFFDEKDRYSNMVKNSIDEDFSWANEQGEGPVYDYLKLFGINR